MDRTRRVEITLDPSRAENAFVTLPLGDNDYIEPIDEQHCILRTEHFTTAQKTFLDSCEAVIDYTN